MLPMVCAALLGAIPAFQETDDLVRLLGSFAVEDRDRAESQLLEKGKAAVPALLNALKNPDSEIAGRGRSILRRLALREWRTGDAAGLSVEIRRALGLPERWTFERRRVIDLGRGYYRHAYPADLGMVARGCSDAGSILLVDLRTGEERLRWPAHPTCAPVNRPSVRSLSFTPDGRFLASCGFDGAVAVWDARTGAIVRRFPVEGEPVALSPDGSLLATGLSAGGIVLLDVGTGREAQRLKGHVRRPYLLQFSPDGRTLASAAGFLGGRCDDASADVKILRLWDVVRGWNLRTLDEGERAGRQGVTVAWSPDGKRLATAGGLSFCVRDATTGEIVYERTLERREIQGVAFSPGGEMLALPLHGAVSLRNAATGNEVGVCTMPPSETIHLRSASFSSDGKRLAASDTLGERVRLWSLDE